MTEAHFNTELLPVGTVVIAFNGEALGTVREAYPHYFLVDQPGEHDDLTVPAHAVLSFEDGIVRISLNRQAASEVDHEETVHYMADGDRHNE